MYVWGCAKSIHGITSLSSSSVFWFCRYFFMRCTWNEIQLEIFPDTHLPFIPDTVRGRTVTTTTTAGTPEWTSVRSQSYSQSLRVQLNCRKKLCPHSECRTKLWKCHLKGIKIHVLLLPHKAAYKATIRLRLRLSQSRKFKWELAKAYTFFKP